MLNLHDSSNILFRVWYTMLNTRLWSFNVLHIFFSSQFLQCVDFKITSKPFPVGSKHASAIPVLDDQPRLFQDPSKLALMSVFLLTAFSKLESCPNIISHLVSLLLTFHPIVFHIAMKLILYGLSNYADELACQYSKY